MTEQEKQELRSQISAALDGSTAAPPEPTLLTPEERELQRTAERTLADPTATADAKGKAEAARAQLAGVDAERARTVLAKPGSQLTRGDKEYLRDAVRAALHNIKHGV